jgi:ABC-type glycerol-3-phosphate transport system substrate-binding protein
MNTLLAISSTTGSKDASWDFVKSFLSEDAQKQVAGNYQIPVLTSAFEDQIKSAMNPDVNGNGMVIYDKMGQVTPMTADAAQAYRDLVNGLNTLASYDQEIVNIVLEEVPEYFDGQKTDKEVAAVIQNRVQTLVNERQ